MHTRYETDVQFLRVHRPMTYPVTRLEAPSRIEWVGTRHRRRTLSAA